LWPSQDTTDKNLCDTLTDVKHHLMGLATWEIHYDTDNMVFDRDMMSTMDTLQGFHGIDEAF